MKIFGKENYWTSENKSDNRKGSNKSNVSNSYLD